MSWQISIGAGSSLVLTRSFRRDPNIRESIGSLCLQSTTRPTVAAHMVLATGVLSLESQNVELESSLYLHAVPGHVEWMHALAGFG